MEGFHTPRIFFKMTKDVWGEKEPTLSRIAFLWKSWAAPENKC